MLFRSPYLAGSAHSHLSQSALVAGAGCPGGQPEPAEKKQEKNEWSEKTSMNSYFLFMIVRVHEIHSLSLFRSRMAAVGRHSMASRFLDLQCP